MFTSAKPAVRGDGVQEMAVTCDHFIDIQKESLNETKKLLVKSK